MHEFTWETGLGAEAVAEWGGGPEPGKSETPMPIWRSQYQELLSIMNYYHYDVLIKVHKNCILYFVDCVFLTSITICQTCV